MHRHLVHFYDQDYPAEAACEFLAAGLEAGNRALALLTAPHRRAVESCLQARGVVLASAAYATVDTDAAWLKMQRDGRLDLRRAKTLLERFMRPPGPEHPHRICVVGDLAPTLYAIGKKDDALAFEGLVHRLSRKHGASILCAYPIAVHCGGAGMDSFMRLSAEHTAVVFPQRSWAHHLVPKARAITAH